MIMLKHIVLSELHNAFKKKHLFVKSVKYLYENIPLCMVIYPEYATVFHPCERNEWVKISVARLIF